MEYAVLVAAIVLGAIFRRWWGGWLSPNSTLKRIVGFILPFVFTWIITKNSYAALWVAVCIEGLWLNSFNSEGFDMGRNQSKPLWYCIAVMGGTNGAYTAMAAAGLAYLTGHYMALFYALTGFLTPLGYLFGWWVNDHIKPKWNSFIDGAGSFGELFLGAISIGGLCLFYLV